MAYKIIKRSFDLFNSLLALIVLSPILLIISVGIKVSSKGPVFFTSERIGMNYIPFKMLKFRSMHVRQQGAVESKYLVNEKRIFKFGKFIRKSKLDELPQLINILKGDMSIVGPRPYPEKFVNKNYVGKYSKILSVKPGLACLDSLYDYAHGELFVTDEKRYAEDVLPVRTELAKKYVEKKGICLDVYCILRTIQLMFDIVFLRKKKFSYTRYEAETIKTLS